MLTAVVANIVLARLCITAIRKLRPTRKVALVPGNVIGTNPQDSCVTLPTSGHAAGPAPAELGNRQRGDARLLRWVARSAGAMATAVVCLGVLAGGGLASSVSVCVPSAAGQPVTSAGPSPGTRASGTKAALPASAADQQALISILPHIRFSSSGVGGQATIKFTDVNVQILNGAGSTATLNGSGNLVLGYDESPSSRPQTGSQDLVLGQRVASGCAATRLPARRCGS